MEGVKEGFESDFSNHYSALFSKRGALLFSSNPLFDSCTLTWHSQVTTYISNNYTFLPHFLHNQITRLPHLQPAINRLNG